MPLLDHFHGPQPRRPQWKAVTGMWVPNVVRWLNRKLPAGQFIAYPTTHLGTEVEADVVEFDLRANGPGANGDETGGVATLTDAPPVVATIPAVFPDDIEVWVGTSYDPADLCGVIEFVSEANKKEADEREAFVNKCAAYLQRGIGVVVIDAVTNRLANLHNLLMRRIGGAAPPLLDGPPAVYAASYRPVRRHQQNLIDVWPYPMAVGAALPPTPFGLRRGPTVVLPLEETYTEALRDLNIVR